MMFRFAVSAGLSVLFTEARRTDQQAVGKTSAPSGYDELPGKCTGHWIENWADGRFSHYGEDHQIDSLDDCADTCDEHPDCAGFYTKNGKCSHWRSGSISANAASGNTCYRKQDGAAPAHSNGVNAGGACNPVQGFNVQSGKCSGRWIETWLDGHAAHYGEDHQIFGLADCASTCHEHNDCSGFYTKDGKCSHWRSGSLSASPNAGHCCYTKSRSSLAQIEDDLDLEMDTNEYELEMSNFTDDMGDEEDIDAETGLPNCCWNSCCHGSPNRRDRCWCNGSMCRARRHGGGYCWNNFHYHHRGGMGRGMGMGRDVHVHYHNGGGYNNGHNNHYGGGWR